MKYTIIGDWYDCCDLSSTFAVVAEGRNFQEAKAKAAEAALKRFPHRAEGEEGETEETFWGGDNGAYIVAAFEGDLGAQAVEAATFEMIA